MGVPTPLLGGTDGLLGFAGTPLGGTLLPAGGIPRPLDGGRGGGQDIETSVLVVCGAILLYKRFDWENDMLTSDFDHVCAFAAQNRIEFTHLIAPNPTTHPSDGAEPHRIPDHHVDS